MPLQHTTATRNAMVLAVTTLVTAGSAVTAGYVQLSNSNAFSTILASLPLNNPAFSAPTGGTASLLQNPSVAPALAADPAAAGGGVASWFRFMSRDNAEVFRGTVSDLNGNGDIKLANTTINPGDRVEITSFTYTTVS